MAAATDGASADIGRVVNAEDIVLAVEDAGCDTRDAPKSRLFSCRLQTEADSRIAYRHGGRGCGVTEYREGRQ